MVQVRGKANFCQGILSRCGGQERIEVASWRIENSESRFHATLGEQLEEERLLLEEVFEGLAGVRVAGRSTRRRRTSSRRLSIRSWRGIFFDGHAKFVEGAVQAFLASLGEMRSWTGWVHSNCAPESKKRHCLQQCNSAWHFGHVPLGSNPGVRTAPQLEHRARVTVPTMRGVRGPN